MFRTGFLSIIRRLVLYDIYLLLCMQYQTPDDEQKTCPKHVQSYSKNKFLKLVHILDFIIENGPGIYFIARWVSFLCQSRFFLIKEIFIVLNGNLNVITLLYSTQTGHFTDFTRPASIQRPYIYTSPEFPNSLQNGCARIRTLAISTGISDLSCLPRVVCLM